jgi:repressor LexA
VENNIRRLRKERGWTMQELAERVEGNPHFTTIAKLERNQRGLSVEWAEKLARALGVAVEDVIAPAGTAGRPRLVPLIGAIAAGSWQEAISDPIGMVYAPAGGPNVFALRPAGDSMNEVIMPGAYVLVDPDQLDLADGKIYAVRNSAGEATLKMYRADPPRLEPRSTNPAHQPIPIGQEPFTLIGRIVWQGMEM